MSRPLRIEFSGALYHITSRGDGREDIYPGDEDRHLFLEVLGWVCERCNWVVHSYCLMDNHYHLLIETPDGNLSLGMRQLNGVYTQRFNRQHHRVGHVFQGRYKAILVQKESYLLELVRYVVLNPVRARMVRQAKNWPWSSYRSTTGVAEARVWLAVDWVLSAFSPQRKAAIKRFVEFVDQGRGQPSPWEQLKNQIYLGDDAFVDDIQCKVSVDQVLEDVPAVQRRRVPRSLSSYEAESATRDEAIVQAYRSGGYSLKVIGEYWGLHYSRVSRIVKLNEVECKI